MSTTVVTTERTESVAPGWQEVLDRPCGEPGCGMPCELLDRFVFGSTNGPVEHLKVRCLRGHWFLRPVDGPSR